MNTVPALRTAAIINAAIAITSSVVLQSLGLVSPIGANQKQFLKYWIPFTVGATGGIRCNIAVPAGGTIYQATFKLFNNVAPSLTTSMQAAAADFTNAIANAGDSFLEVELLVINGGTAGNVDIQMAQNTSDALTLTIKRGGFLEVTKM